MADLQEACAKKAQRRELLSELGRGGRRQHEAHKQRRRNHAIRGQAEVEVSLQRAQAGDGMWQGETAGGGFDSGGQTIGHAAVSIDGEAASTGAHAWIPPPPRRPCTPLHATTPRSANRTMQLLQKRASRAPALCGSWRVGGGAGGGGAGAGGCKRGCVEIAGIAALYEVAFLGQSRSPRALERHNEPTLTQLNEFSALCEN